MIKKKYIKSRDISKITFELSRFEIPGDLQAESVHLVGDFNNWDTTATPMKYLKKGTFQAILELEPGREYQFRYLINGETWHNDWEADDYILSDIGTDNCVIKVPAK